MSEGTMLLILGRKQNVTNYDFKKKKSTKNIGTVKVFPLDGITFILWSYEYR